MIAEAGGVPALVKLVQSSLPPLQGPAVTAPLNVVLSCDGGNTPATLGAAAVAAQAIPSAIQMLRSDPEIVHREAAMYFLAIMVPLDDDSRTHVAHAIPLIVRSLVSRSAKLQEQSAEVIKSLVFSAHCHTGNRVSVLAAGAVPALVRMLRHPGSEKAEHLALKALLALSCEDPDTPAATLQLTRIRFAKAGAIPPLVRLLTSDKSDTKAMSLIVLAGLTQNADCCRRVAAAGAVPLLEQIVDNNGCEEMQARAEWVLSIIAEQRKAEIQAEALACAATPLATDRGRGDDPRGREHARVPSSPICSSDYRRWIAKQRRNLCDVPRRPRLHQVSCTPSNSAAATVVCA